MLFLVIVAILSESRSYEEKSSLSLLGVLDQLKHSYDVMIGPHALVLTHNKLPLFYYILILPPVINVNIFQGYNGSLILQIGTIYSWEIEKSELMITKTV